MLWNSARWARPGLPKWSLTWSLAWVLTWALIAAGCSGSKLALGGDCTSSDDCAGGQVCEENQCVSLCSTSEDCPSGQGCAVERGLCVDLDSVSAKPPEIHRVDGNGRGNIDPHAFAVGTLSDHRYRTSLSIEGRNLKDSIVALDDGTGSPIFLEPLTMTNTLIVAAIPEADAPRNCTDSEGDVTGICGRYSLTVVNQDTGQDSVEVWLLKGEDGVTPSPTELKDIVLSLPELHRGELWGRFYEAEGSPQDIGVETGANIPDSSASGGFVRQLSDGAEPGIGYLFTSETDPLSNPIAVSDSIVTFRVKVDDNVGDNPLVTLSCGAKRTAAAATFTPIDGLILTQADFDIPGEWESFILRCDFRPGDLNQRIAMESFVPGMAKVSLDYVRVSPVEACACP
jgi:hypothetical protein